MHYVLVHFDVPDVDPATFELVVDGRVRAPAALTLDALRARPAVTMAVMMECAGSGRAHLAPRPVSAPWHDEAIGCAEWTGTPLRGVLEDAGLLDDAVELLFTGCDHGIDQGVEQDYQRSLPIEEAMRDDVLLAYAMNGQPLPASHGFPLRLIVPEWYGMASVKWLRSITAIAEPFEGVQQTLLYNYRRSEEDPATPVTRKRPRALMAPPGMPEFLSRARHVRAGRTLVRGGRGRGRTPSAASSSAPTAGAPGRTPAWRSPTASTAGAGGPVTGTPPSQATTSSASAQPTRRQRSAARQRRGLEPGRVRRQRGPARARPRDLADRAPLAVRARRRRARSATRP